jgi:histidinol phosphatase-like enzyme
MSKAVFFDVDGVIRENNTNSKDGCYYCLSYDQVKYLPDIFEAHKFLQDAGYKIFWITMQNCIKEGKIEEQDVHFILMGMCEDFKNYGIYIDDYQICISKDENDPAKIESKINAVNKLSMVYNIDLSKSIGIGDREHDILAYKECEIPIRIQSINRFGDKKSIEATHHYFYSDIFSSIANVFSIEDLDNLFDCYKQVDKIWGREYWIVNDECGNYCSKILKLRLGHKASLHYHKEKHETFTVLSGLARITLNGTTKVYSKGESVCIKPNIQHTFEAYGFPAYILETSTLHSDDDVVRIEVSR